MNKCLNVIGIVLALLLFPYCSGERAQRPEGHGSSAHAALAGIDSLMWRRADSAFVLLQEFVVSPEAKELDTYDEHYCQVLISELLYKKDYEQSNREDLLKAVDYFDSLTANTRTAPQLKRNVFLDARAHYINGVGFYEDGDMVQACAEYLKALEIMEGHYEDKALTGKKAIFMTYTYNRLTELFSEQFMMDPAIVCGERALMFCRIEPTSSEAISNNLYYLGKQYDKMDDVDKAKWYYGLALEELKSTDNLVYRNIISSKALCDYLSGSGIDQPIMELKSIVMQADDESERLTRFLTIGDVFFNEGLFDSASFYLEPVFQNEEDVISQIHAAECLRIMYDKLGNSEKSIVCVQFLADHKKSEGENKAMTSKLEDMFKAYINQKQKKEAEKAREESIRKLVEIIVPIAVFVTLAIIVVAKLKSKQLLKEQQEEADRVLGETEKEHEKELRLWQAEADKTLEETEKKHEEELRVQKDKSEKEIEKTKKRHEKELKSERLAYQKEQEALQQNLQEKEAQVNVLEKALNQQREEAKQHREVFFKEPICQHILSLARGKHITTRDVAHKLGIALKDEDFSQLKEAVAKHYEGFDHVLLSECPNLKNGYLELCYLHLLGLNESEIAALKNVSYSAIRKQNESLQEKFKVDENISAYILKVADGLCGTQIIDQEKQINMALQRTKDGDLGHFEEKKQKSSLKSSLKSSQKILELISASPSITISEIAERLGMTKRGVDKNIKRLKEQGIIRRVGPDKGGHWEVVEQL